MPRLPDMKIPSGGTTEQTTTVKKDNTNQTSKSGRSSSSSVFGSKELDSGVQGQVSNITRDLMTGKLDVGKTLTNINNMIQKALMGTLNSKLIEMLLAGNDIADATAAQGKTAANVSKGAITISKLQDKLITANIDALQELLTTGQIDIQTYSNNLMNSMIEVGVKGCEIDLIGEENETKKKENEDLEKQIQDKLSQNNMKMEKDEEGNMIFKDSSGNPADLNNDSELKGLVDKIQENNTIIAANNETMTQITQTNKIVTDNVVEGIQDVVVQGNDLGATIMNVAANMITDAGQEITNTLLDNIGLLQTDAVTAGVNAATDTAAAAAAPGIAAAETAGTFGLGAGHASTILANGVADGFASGIRTLTGSTAMGGIVTNMAAGQTLGQAVSNVLISESRSYINDQIMGGVKEFTAQLTETTTEETNKTNKRISEHGIKTDENNRA